MKKKEISFSGHFIDMGNVVKGLVNATLHLLHLVSILHTLVSVIFKALEQLGISSASDTDMLFKDLHNYLQTGFHFCGKVGKICNFLFGQIELVVHLSLHSQVSYIFVQLINVTEST